MVKVEVMFCIVYAPLVDIVGEDAGSSEFACHDGEDSCACACVNNVTISYVVLQLEQLT